MQVRREIVERTDAAYRQDPDFKRRPLMDLNNEAAALYKVIAAYRSERTSMTRGQHNACAGTRLASSIMHVSTSVVSSIDMYNPAFF